jgi:hypothetical protein
VNKVSDPPCCGVFAGVVVVVVVVAVDFVPQEDMTEAPIIDTASKTHNPNKMIFFFIVSHSSLY